MYVLWIVDCVCMVRWGWWGWIRGGGGEMGNEVGVVGVVGVDTSVGVVHWVTPVDCST